MIGLGKSKDWNGLLELIIKEQMNFDNVNYATAMSQLGRIWSFDKSDPRFLSYMQGLVELIEKRGLPWIQARSISNIVHAVAKMQIKNQSTEQITNWISQPEVAAQFVKEGNPQAVANTVWAFATLGYDAPNMFAEIEQNAE